MPGSPPARYPGLPHHGAHESRHRQRQARGEGVKLADGGGPFLVVQPERLEILAAALLLSRQGANPIDRPYPIVSLADARQKREQAKRQIIAGTDPSVQKKLDRIAAEATSRNTFGIIAGEYIERLEATARRNRR